MTLIEGTLGNDNLTGTANDDEIYGFDGNDFLYGGTGDDLIVGGDGNDWLDGEAGADTMNGGHGNDTYYVDDSSDVIVEAADGDEDTAQISASYFDMGTAYIEWAYYIETGACTILGSDGANNIFGGTGADWLEGKGGNDWLDGGAGNDRLDGGAGNDFLDGWLGNDTMIGGAGDDIYIVESSLDVVTENAGEGIDTVRVKRSSYTLPTDVENADLRYYSGTISVTGNAANNLFLMGAGSQTVNGGAGIDTVSYAAASAGVTVDLATGEKSGEAGDDNLVGIENLIGSAYDDVLRTSGGGNILDGGLGADTMVGRAGSDIYYVDNVGDTVIETAGGGLDEVRVQYLSSYTLPDQVEKLTNVTDHLFTGTGNALANEMNGGGAADTFHGLAGNDTLYGGGGDDVLDGGDGHDFLNGGVGADAMTGGLGNDLYVVDNAGDTVAELADEGTDQVQTTLSSYTLTFQVENLLYCAGGNFTGTGNGIANVITGQSGDDALSGMGGADELRGGMGDDLLDGGDGDDLLLGGAGADVLTSGDGGDMYRFAQGDSGTGAAADRITDFAWPYDKIDLREVDANGLTAGDQAFSFIGTAAFSGAAGELRYGFDGTDTWLQGDFDGDGTADFEIVFTGNVSLVSGDFYL